MTTVAEPRMYEREDGTWVIPRIEFAANRFDYKPGQHVVFGGPTQRGKSTLAFTLLDYVATPELPAYVAVSKPHDPVTDTETKRMGFRRVEDWPPTKKLGEVFGEKPRGYVIWPKFGDIKLDVARGTDVTSRLISDRYAAGARRKGAGILFMDDTYVKSKVYKLDGDMTTILAMAGAMDLGMWIFVQKPTGSGDTAIWGYGASEHLFLAKDSDGRSRERYDEIGGVDPKEVSRINKSLGRFQFLYINRTHGYMCIVDDK